MIKIRSQIDIGASFFVVYGWQMRPELAVFGGYAAGVHRRGSLVAGMGSLSVLRVEWTSAAKLPTGSDRKG
jgi:hypothetical protein